MRTVDLEEVDELLVLSHEDLEGVLDVGVFARAEVLRRLPRRLLTREEADQLVDLRAVLVDDVLREVLH